MEKFPHASINSWPPQARRRIAGALTGIDDTLTTAGAITQGALKAAGLPVIAVTGRPAGWSEALDREWSVNAIVAETAW